MGPEFDDNWRRTVTADAQSHVTRTTLTHDSGLVVTREMRVLPDFDAVEYQLYFKNTAGNALPAVSAIHALNISFGGSILDGNRVISSGDGLADGLVPLRSFAIRKMCTTPRNIRTGFCGSIRGKRSNHGHGGRMPIHSIDFRRI